jgi:hypothetical protein
MHLILELIKAFNRHDVAGMLQLLSNVRVF